LQGGTRGEPVGDFALTGLLIDCLLPVSGSRVVTVSSIGHRIQAAIHFDDLQWQRSYSRADSYGQAIQKRLWTISEELTGVTFPVR
jgi:hypothetical protein